MLKHISMPYTQNGLELNLTAEQEENCRVLYKHVKDDLYEFAGFYAPKKKDADYPDGMLALPVRSVYSCNHILHAGTSVWNVIGSTRDPKVDGKSWIQLWMDKTHGQKKCYVEDSAHIDCNGNIYGGHMVLHANNVRPRHGSNGVVYIIPICNAHNNANNVAEMILSEDVEAVVLNRYFEKDIR